MSYGEWLLFKNEEPYFYFNIFDDDYLAFREVACENVMDYLANILVSREKEWSLRQRIFYGCNNSTGGLFQLSTLLI